MCRFLRKREQEISSIVQSIEDLNTIFKDLAQMVSEQVSQNVPKSLKPAHIPVPVIHDAEPDPNLLARFGSGHAIGTENCYQ